MKRTLNFTGRQKIPRRNVTLLLNREDGAARSFTARFDLSGFHFPEEARVYFEAYHRTDQKRYAFGTVGAVTTPPDTSLTNLARIENLKFRLLIVDERGRYGLILAQADGISPVHEGERRPILPVDFRDLGQQVWKVEYEGAEGAPIITLNSRLPNIQTLVKSDPLFLFFVFPSVIREVLTHMVFIDGVDSVEEPSVDWHEDWLQFARMILGGEGPPDTLNAHEKEHFDEEKAQEWIDRVVEGFCSSRKEWSHFTAKFREGGTE